ncbi:MAG: hypothetical protein COV52_04975 [Gammaproteobacteria bacterium CG11_big_fil_rev_8_21_14_0_20_46_22]|nr:MAG: hypothetical protein COW05_04740 [Gammaproteobacteria bacterium CG12_big_fil_rev_8_21_14_0_65_46_12]PIR11216.1 MAG: hypothetical protein COV52_04975 [Gammaproteobacteria bacterium CG11_big_fil_rev_8_21_14_0_20_46_22]
MNQKPLNTESFPLRWVDMDAYQHLNNGKYFDLMGETRAAFIHAVCPGLETFYVLIDVGCQFIKPLTYPDTVTIKQYLTAYHKASFEMRYEIFSSDEPNKPAAKGHAKLCCIDAKTQKVCAIPEALKAAFTRDNLTDE